MEKFKLYRLRPGYNAGGYTWREEDLLVVKYENGYATLYKSSNDELHGWKPGVKYSYPEGMGPDWIPYATPKNHLPDWF